MPRRWHEKQRSYFPCNDCICLDSFVNRNRGNSWEFPVLGKYYLHPPVPRFHPFVSVGADLRTIGSSYDSSAATTDATGVSHMTASVLHNRSSDAGVTAGAGLWYRLGALAVLPEIRYTRWSGSENVTSRNETRLLLGINF